MKFQHNIPNVGAVKLILDGRPARLYKIMREKGEINRLNKLLHLGVIQDQFPGMRHTRLDYTMTMLYLTHRLKKARREGLSPESRVGSIRLSGRDTLQILALISNIGHLPGTFAVEKGVMRFIVKNDLLDILIKEQSKLSEYYG